MQTTSIVARNDAAENDAILTRQCNELAQRIVSGLEIDSTEAVAVEIKKLAEHWADGTRECCALIAEEMRETTVAMVIRGQIDR